MSFRAMAALGGLLLGLACERVVVDPCGEPVARAQANPTEGLPPLVVELRGEGHIEGGIGPLDSLQWVFGNGRTSTKPIDTTTYETVAVYQPYLLVRGCGLTDTAFVTIMVR
jgi:PKD repeat protein